MYTKIINNCTRCPTTVGTVDVSSTSAAAAAAAADEIALERSNGASSCSARVQRNSNDRGRIARDVSEPNLRKKADMLDASFVVLRANGRSLENILENDETELMVDASRGGERAEALVLEDRLSSQDSTRGAIPKRVAEARSRVTVNPLVHDPKKLTTSRTYFCLKSILKQNRRRYTLVTTDELQSYVDKEQQQHLASSGVSFLLSLFFMSKFKVQTIATYNKNNSQASDEDLPAQSNECARECHSRGDKPRVNWSSREGGLARNLSSNSHNKRKKHLSRENSLWRRDPALCELKRDNSGYTYNIL